MRYWVAQLPKIAKIFKLCKDNISLESLTLEEAIATLKALGLTLVQSKVYIVLAKSNALTIATLSKLSKVPRTDLYRVVKKLEQKGLVERVIATPVKFHGISLKEGVNLLINLKNQENRVLLEKANSLLQTYGEKTASKIAGISISKFILIPHARVIDRIRKAIDAAQETVNLIISSSRFAQGVFLYQENVQRSLSREVQWRFIIERPANAKLRFNTLELLPKSPLCKVRYISSAPKTITGIYDQKQVFIIEQSKAGLSESPALWSNNKSLIALATGHFEKLWDTAQCVDPETEKEPI
jgi:sugar-specific transcriptional regulator TrmB